MKTIRVVVGLKWRQIKPCKRRKITDSGIVIIHWNIISSMKWFKRVNLYYCIHNQATKWILHIIRIVDIHSVMFRGITEIVYKNDCNDEQRYLNVWYTYITALNRYVFEKKATVTKIENQIALIFALKKSCCSFRSIW